MGKEWAAKARKGKHELERARSRNHTDANPPSSTGADSVHRVFCGAVLRRKSRSEGRHQRSEQGQQVATDSQQSDGGHAGYEGGTVGHDQRTCDHR